jgi:very-long-chain ceramide synthase
MFKSPYWFDTTHFWKGYPHVEMSSLFKWYYLLQLAFCIQQVIALHIEDQEDYLETLIHHMVAALLICCSYLMNLTRVGNAVLCTMDFSDILLPVSQFNLIGLFNLFLFIISFF